ncbi:MAG: hypothetical protein IH850_03830 [Acidobacteria bacterium]|nr:hypothetical protein [Acidobacteriota bacterium]
MPFRFPIMLVIFFLIFTGGRIIPFVFVAFGLWFLLGVMRQGTRIERRPGVTSDELDDLRTEVAIGLLEVDDDNRLTTNKAARSRLETAGRYYTKASATLDRGVRRRERDAVAETLYRARYELEAVSASLDGRTVSASPGPPTRATAVKVATPSSRRRRAYYCCW